MTTLRQQLNALCECVGDSVQKLMLPATITAVGHLAEIRETQRAASERYFHSESYARYRHRKYWKRRVYGDIRESASRADIASYVAAVEQDRAFPSDELPRIERTVNPRNCGFSVDPSYYDLASRRQWRDAEFRYGDGGYQQTYGGNWGGRFDYLSRRAKLNLKDAA